MKYNNKTKILLFINIICVLICCFSIHICFETNKELRYFIQESKDNNNVLGDSVSETVEDKGNAARWTIIGPAYLDDPVLKVIYNSKDESEYFTYGTEYCVKEIQVVECPNGTECFYLIPLEINIKNKEGIHTLCVQGKDREFFVSDSGN